MKKPIKGSICSQEVHSANIFIENKYFIEKAVENAAHGIPKVVSTKVFLQEPHVRSDSVAVPGRSVTKRLARSEIF